MPDLQRLNDAWLRAKAAGITAAQFHELVKQNTDLDWIEQQIDKLYELEGDYALRIAQHSERRRRIAAAYMAGASLNQIAYLEQVTSNTIHNLVRKELSREVMAKIASERTQRGRRRAPEWTPTQVSAMFAAASKENVRRMPVVLLAAKMREAAKAAADLDERDAYTEGDLPTKRLPDAEHHPDLHGSSTTEADQVRDGQVGRGGGDTAEAGAASGQAGGSE